MFKVISRKSHAIRGYILLSNFLQQHGQFFQEIGRPQTGTPVTPEDLERFAVISARYGHWNAEQKL